MGLPSPLRLCLAAAIVLAMAGTAAAAEPTRITIGMSSVSISGATARIAERMGMFAKHGLDATVTAMDNNNVATTALLAGSVDFVTSAPSDVIVAQARGQNLVALTSSYRGFAAVLVLSNAAIEKTHVSPTAPVSDRLKALDGLIIATPSATSTFTVAPKSAAASVGAKFRLTYMSQPAMVAALKSGAIDGIVCSAPFYVQPVLDGSGTIWINGPKGPQRVHTGELHGGGGGA
jgi:ABC-type nitrate/sulfonate/bicarbonate transport system substrate-binding protein